MEKKKFVSGQVETIAIYIPETRQFSIETPFVEGLPLSTFDFHAEKTHDDARAWYVAFLEESQKKT